jgi:hypothetical protein
MLSPQFQPKAFETPFCVLLSALLLIALAGAAQPAAAATPQLVCSTTRLKFGWVAVGSTETQLVVLTNTGSKAVNISGVRVTGTEFKVSGSGFPKTLAAGKSTTLNVTFEPSVEGWISRDLTFKSDASNPDLPLSVRGTAVKKEPVTANPVSLSFGQVAVGSTKKLSVSLTNHCLCNQTISALNVVDSAFSVTNPNLPITLGRGDSITINISFSPKAAGLVGGSVLAAGPFVNIPLTGTGGSSVGGVLVVNPGSVNFGSVEVGTTGTETSSLTATGGSVTVTSASSSNGQFTISGVSFPVTIPSGQSVSFGVVFKPKSAGTASANLSFANTGSTANAVEALAGQATMPYVTLSWSPSPSDVSGYNIYRSTASSGPFSRLNTKLDSGTSFVDKGVSLGNTYFYATTAVNSAGQESSYSNLAQVQVP